MPAPNKLFTVFLPVLRLDLVICAATAEHHHQHHHRCVLNPYYNPVCGTDMRTYANRDILECLNHQQPRERRKPAINALTLVNNAGRLLFNFIAYLVEQRRYSFCHYLVSACIRYHSHTLHYFERHLISKQAEWMNWRLGSRASRFKRSHFSFRTFALAYRASAPRTPSGRCLVTFDAWCENYS